LIFSNFVATNAYVVGVDSFVEGRRIIPKYKPYRGGPVDDQRYGMLYLIETKYFRLNKALTYIIVLIFNI
jgi:hypothetical protein